MSKDDLQKQFLELLASGKLQPSTVVLGDNIDIHDNHDCPIYAVPPSSAEATPPSSTGGHSASSTASESTELSPADKAILAVHEARICEPSDWAAVIRLFKEREMMQPNGLPFDAAYINRVCGKPVTSESSLSRSIMTTKIGGKYPYWCVKQDEETRQTPNKLRLYNEIGRIVTEAIK